MLRQAAMRSREQITGARVILLAHPHEAALELDPGDREWRHVAITCDRRAEEALGLVEVAARGAERRLGAECQDVETFRAETSAEGKRLRLFSRRLQDTGANRVEHVPQRPV